MHFLVTLFIYLFYFILLSPFPTPHSTMPMHLASHETIKDNKAIKAQNETESNSAFAPRHNHEEVEDSLDEDLPKNNREKKVVLPPDMVVVETGDKLEIKFPPKLPSLLPVLCCCCGGGV